MKKNKKKAIIVDIDGTLALFSHHRSPYDTQLCEGDEPNVPIVMLLDSLVMAEKDLAIILVSGRFEEFMPQTRNWLNKYEIPYDHLFMRPEGDKREDSIIKKEIYESKIKDKYDVWFVVDDRPRVVRMWRYDLGFTVFQLNDKEF